MCDLSQKLERVFLWVATDIPQGLLHPAPPILSHEAQQPAHFLGIPPTDPITETHAPVVTVPHQLFFEACSRSATA